MKNTITLTLLGALAFATPSFAQTAVQEDAQKIQSDDSAIQKDNASLSKDNGDIAKDRAKKAADKANGDYGKQAVDSLAIGADKTMKGEKSGEKDVDQKILQHHTNNLNSDVNSTSNQ